MGPCLSLASGSARLLDDVDGDDIAFHDRFLEDKILGEGEFGVVKMVHDTKQNHQLRQQTPNTTAESTSTGSTPLSDVMLACKTLRKGIIMRDNVVYSPLKPEVLKGEVKMLRTLEGKNFCLRLVAVYESSRTIMMVTEFCGGGEMMEWVASLHDGQDLRTEHVSRIAYQLLSAVNHCANHNVIHRDIKPENLMFKEKDIRAELRLIDFGSGVMDEKAIDVNDPNPDDLHTTFAGSAFYISPEVYQRTYTNKTDVWSCGVVLYVLVSGYPANELQTAFDILQMSTNRNLRALPNIPANLPDSFFMLLEDCLTFRHKKRPSAQTLLQHEFVQFHNTVNGRGSQQGMSLNDIAAEAAGARLYDPANDTSTASVSLRASVHRHAAFLGFKMFERSLTTILATMLTDTELEKLLTVLRDRLGNTIKIGTEKAIDTQHAADIVAAMDQTSENLNDRNIQHQEQKLAVIPIGELKTILKNDLNKMEILEAMVKIPNSSVYDSFAYHIALLMDFSPTIDNKTNMGSSGRKKTVRRGSHRRSRASSVVMGNNHILTNSHGSQSSIRSLRSSLNNSTSRAANASMKSSKPKRSQSVLTMSELVS